MTKQACKKRKRFRGFGGVCALFVIRIRIYGIFVGFYRIFRRRMTSRALSKILLNPTKILLILIQQTYSNSANFSNIHFSEAIPILRSSSISFLMCSISVLLPLLSLRSFRTYFIRLRYKIRLFSAMSLWR